MMIRPAALMALGLASALCAPTSAAGQAKRLNRGVQLGPVAGVNIFTLGGSDASGAKSRTTFYAGAALNFPLGGTAFFQPEVLYMGKGATTTVFDSTVGTINGELKFAYVEVPLLFGLNLGASETHVRIYAGPAVGLNISCDLSASSGGSSFSSSCDQVGFSIKSLDAGVTGGGGIVFPLGGGGLSLEARYTLGLTEVSTGSNAKNQGFSIGASLTFPLHRK